MLPPDGIATNGLTKHQGITIDSKPILHVKHTQDTIHDNQGEK
jgi:hypothetical protein